MPRNHRRIYDEHGREIEPAMLANMRAHRVRSVGASCEDCQHARLPLGERLGSEEESVDIIISMTKVLSSLSEAQTSLGFGGLFALRATVVRNAPQGHRRPRRVASCRASSSTLPVGLPP